ncbi:MAG: hypothetical protein ACYCSW_09615 [bacterium]|jgi:predicted nucleotidyltransferase
MAVTQKQIERIIALAKVYGATRLILFGSAVETPEKARDIDLACDPATAWKDGNSMSLHQSLKKNSEQI